MNRVQKLFTSASRLIYKSIKPKTSKSNLSYSKEIPSLQEGNNIIGKMIQQGAPFLIARFGASEMKILNNFQIIEKTREWSFFRKYIYSVKSGNKTYFKNEYKNELRDNSGFFHNEDEYFYRFCQLYKECVKRIDVLAVWNLNGEAEFHKNYLPQADLIPFTSLEPYYYENPWSQALKHKKVLVVHPFAKSIEINFRNREQIYPNGILPDFDLVTIKAIQTLYGNPSEFPTWFDALESMLDKIKTKDFDLAIIGAGAYGLPLGSMIKDIGRQAILLGGATQILFGIKGNRWENHPVISKLFNEYWTRPIPEEHFGNYKKMENACYW
jgi:hypothetical protein